MDVSLSTYLFIGILVVWLLFTLIISIVVKKDSRWSKFGLSLGNKICPNCNEPLPIIRKPKNSNQALYGGWTCQNCKTELDKYGNPLS